MHDRLDPRGIEAPGFEALDELVLVQRIADAARQPALGRRARELIDDHDVAPAGDEVGHQVAADEAGAPRHDDHGGSARRPDVRRREGPQGLEPAPPLARVMPERMDARATGLQ